MHKVTGTSIVATSAVFFSCLPFLFELSPVFGLFNGPFKFGVLVVVPIAAIASIWGVLGMLLRTSAAPFYVHKRALLIGAGCLALLTLSSQIERLMRQDLPVGSLSLRFDPAKWKQPHAAYGFFSGRQAMLGDLVRNVLPGRTRVEIETLLGTDGPTEYFKDLRWDFIYVTGPERNSPYPIDSEWLLIWLDAKGKFRRYEIRTD